ncbi:hypothetical protein QFZ35_003023 [Arthrobacter ulcerisalmonis]|nr:hypothetical protein [Arthrobacter ulcerisalmonis]MDQ0664525.1 hypothetical protein [Arthrobacter ulcerisalmonis]
MSPLLIGGLAVAALGALVWLIAPRLAKFAAQSKAYLKPDLDQERERQRQVVLIRTVGTAQILFGLGIVLFWAINNGRES